MAAGRSGVRGDHVKITLEYDSVDEMFAGASALTAQSNNPQVVQILALAQRLAASSAQLKAVLPVSST